MKNLIAFLFGWLIAAAILIPQAHAALSVSPSVPGYSSGMFSSAAGGFSMTAANDGFIKPSIVNVGAKALTVPATLRMAANAGQFAKNAMKLNPWGIVGTLAAGWLLDHGLDYVNNQWQKTTNSPDWLNGYYWFIGTGTACSSSSSTCGAVEAVSLYASVTLWNNPNVTSHSAVTCTAAAGATSATCTATHVYQSTTTVTDYWYPQRGNPAVSITQPATDADWDALPDPLAVVAPELPYAPYMPDGVPVDAPNYDFAPMSVPVGDPYTKADGSTAQPMAKVSPNGDSVTLDTYDQPVTDTSGNPVQNPTPQDTQEPQQSECEKHPGTIGCAEFGTPVAPDTIPTTQVPVNATATPIGGAGSCPANVTTSHFGITWSYQPICDFADAIRPLIVGFSWLSFAYIVAGSIRT